MTWFMTKGLDDEIIEALQDSLADGALAEEDFNEILTEKISSLRSDFRKRLRKSLSMNAPKMLRERRKMRKRFERRNFERWRPAFDLFEELIVISTELGEALDQEDREKAQKNYDFKFEVLSNLHPRSVLISQEIYCLLRGGYPDAALGRWRTLHETFVVATFISSHDQATALRYLASWHFNALRAATQYVQYQERANLKPFGDEALQNLKDICDQLQDDLGRAIGRDYDWAREALGKGNKDRIAFSDLEVATGLDHWRPRYRWATQNTHPAHRPASNLLANVETDRKIHLVGPSNSGFVDPLQMTAISLSGVTSRFLLLEPTFERVMFSELIQSFSDDIGIISINEEKKTYKAHKKYRRWYLFYTYIKRFWSHHSKRLRRSTEEDVS